MNHSRNFVHNLVKSLTSIEKAFIKKNKNKSYTKNFTQNKNYLRQKVIEGLVQYGIKQSTEIERRNLLNIITVLIEKGFFKRAKDMIDNILLIAGKYEDYTICYDLSIVIRKIYSSNISYSLCYKEINKYAENRRFYLKQLNRFERLAGLNDIHLSTIDGKEKIKAITKYLKKIGFHNDDALPEDYPFSAKRIFYFTKSELAKLENNTNDRNFYIKEIFKLFQNYPHFIEKDFSGYLVDSINYLNSFLSSSNYNSFFNEHQKIITQINQLKKEVLSKDSYRLHILQYLFPQNAYNNSEKYEDASSFAVTYKDFIESNKNDLSEHFIATSITQIAIAHLYNQQFEKALDIIEPYSKIKIYTHQYTFRLLQILCHYFLNNDMLMPYLFNSFGHYLKTAEKKVQTKGILALKKALNRKKIETIDNQIFESFFYLRWELLNDFNKKIFRT